MDTKKKGGLIALCSVSIISFDSLLVKLVDVAPWDLIFWRGALLSATLYTVSLLFINRKKPAKILVFTPLAFLGGVAFAGSTSFFVLALNNTQVVSALVIFNMAPIFSAVIAFIFLKEKLPLHTVMALLVAIAGIIFIFEYAPAAGQMRGDIFALISGISSASYLVSLRANKGNDGITFLILGGMIMAVIALFNGAQPSTLSGLHIIYMAILGCIIVPASGLCTATATKYLPAAQVGLILLLEILFGPLLVYLVLQEEPSIENVIGGSLVLVTLICHTLWEAYIFKNSLFTLQLNMVENERKF